MFDHLTGILSRRAPPEAVVETGGVGYLLRLPQSTYSSLPPDGQRVTLLTHLHVTDDALTLFGFASEEERRFFLLLQHVSGVGPKLALAVLSGGRVEHLQRAIRLGDFAMLKSIRGVGEATAKRIVLELGKILVKEAQTAAAPPAEKKDAASAAAVPGAAAEDQLVDLAVRAVVELNQVTSDVAFRAVQRAYDELRAAGRSPAVQDLIKHSLPYAQ